MAKGRVRAGELAREDVERRGRVENTLMALSAPPVAKRRHPGCMSTHVMATPPWDTQDGRWAVEVIEVVGLTALKQLA